MFELKLYLNLRGRDPFVLHTPTRTLEASGSRAHTHWQPAAAVLSMLFPVVVLATVYATQRLFWGLLNRLSTIKLRFVFAIDLQY